MAKTFTDYTPKEIVAELDKYIIGQDKAKRSVAVALRNRYRRNQLSEEIKEYDRDAVRNIPALAERGGMAVYGN